MIKKIIKIIKKIKELKSLKYIKGYTLYIDEYHFRKYYRFLRFFVDKRIDIRSFKLKEYLECEYLSNVIGIYTDDYLD